MTIFKQLLAAFTPGAEAFVFLWVLTALGITALIVGIERFKSLSERTDYDAMALFHSVKELVEARKLDEAFRLCAAGGKRILPRILGAGIRKAMIAPGLVSGAMAEESSHMSAALEKRLSLLVMFSNVSTLLGLLGTVYGLIMSFGAVSNVSAVEKSSLLAAGISAAMNSTLVGLTISVSTIIVFSFLRARVDVALAETDRYAVSMLNILLPPDYNHAPLKSLSRRGGGEEEEVADADVTPMLNLMVMLIPFLLTSSEFVKIGTIEMKLPKSEAGISGDGPGGGGAPEQQETKLDLIVAVTSKGFVLSHYFKTKEMGGMSAEAAAALPPDVPLTDGEFDYTGLQQKLLEVKRRTLSEIVRSVKPDFPGNSSLLELDRELAQLTVDAKLFGDNTMVKMVAEDKTRYQTVINVMDAARNALVPTGRMLPHENRPESAKVVMFPNIVFGAGIIQ